MRPTKQQTDLEFWMNAVQHWKAKVEEWFMFTAAKGLTPDDLSFAEQCEANAREQQYRAELKYQEALGLIEVYTGRAKPEWA